MDITEIGREDVGWIYLTHSKVQGREDVGWIYLTHSKAHWRALVNMVMNFQVK
jgi:hypothetical protein